MRPAILASLLLVLGACASTSPRNQPFQLVDLAPYEQDGKGSITGLLRATEIDDWGETKHYGRWTDVSLVPSTPYTTEWYEREVVNGERLAPEDPRLAEFRRVTSTDARGHFRFDGVGPGSYFLTGIVRYLEDEDTDPEGWPTEVTVRVTVHGTVKFEAGQHIEGLVVSR
jgi:hypothetical protein